jgi:hypothetical protein
LTAYNRSTFVPEGPLHLAVDLALGLCPYVGPSPSPQPQPSTSGVAVEAIVLPVVLGSLLFIVVVLVIVGSVVYLKFIWKPRRYFDEGVGGLSKSGAEEGDIEMESAFSYREVDWGDLKLGKLLGQGAFGKVYKGEYRCVRSGMRRKLARTDH